MFIKIGLVSPFLPEKDGIAIYSDNILKGLGKDKRHVVSIGRKGSEADYIVNFKSFSLRDDLEKIIKKERLNLIHIQYVPSLFGKYNLNYSLIKALEVSIPSIVTLHEVHYSIRSFKDKLLEFIERRIIKKARLIIVHTPKQRKFLEDKYQAKNIIYIYHGLNLFEAHKRKNNSILCFGMISKNKGIKYLIKAMDYLPDFNLTIAGSFVDKRIEKEIRHQLELSKAEIKTEFSWIGEEKKAEYYNNADIVVLPYTWAPYQSGILHNAVAFGLPVVVTKAGALWEMADEFKLGEIVMPQSPKELAEGIKRVSKNYKKYQKGIIKYRKAANWPKIAEEHLRVYLGSM